MDSDTRDTSVRRLALHACCGPCLLEPYDALSEEAYEVVVVYFNPNIHPVQEYEHRRETLADYAQRAGIEVIEIPYDPALWLESVAPHARCQAERCRACYRLRLGEVARWAAANACDALATTLSVSPYQDQDAIAQEGERAAEVAGVEFVRRDFRDRYPEATRRSRELEMYRQNYCGCLMSEIEARNARLQRREMRRAQKSAGNEG